MMNYEPRYEITYFDGNDIQIDSVDTEQLQKMPLQDYDLCIHEPKSELSFNNANGKRVTYKNEWPGIGDVTYAVLKALLDRTNESVGKNVLARLTQNNYLDIDGVLAARIYALRKSLQNKDFIQTKRSRGKYLLAWNPRYTWVRIRRIEE